MSMTLIEHIEVGSGGTSEIVLDDIPDTFTDLLIVGSFRTSGSNDFARIKFNDSTSDFTHRVLAGAGSGSGTSFANDPNTYLTTAVPSSFTASTFSNISFYIPNYRSSSFKSYSTDGVTENNATLARQVINAGLWSNTAAITKISLYLTSDNYVQYSSATLYGITAGSDGTTTVS